MTRWDALEPLTDAQRALAESELDQVRRFVVRYCLRAPRADRDLVTSAAQLGLLHAARRWDPGKARTAFKTYAWYWMRSMVRREVLAARSILAPAWLAEAPKNPDAVAVANMARRPLDFVALTARPDRAPDPRAERVQAALDSLDPVARELASRTLIGDDRMAQVERDLGLKPTHGYHARAKAVRRLRILLDDLRGAA